MNRTLFRIAIAGNPNSGKTSVYNLLTGERQQVANYGGVTVESQTGHFLLGNDMEIEIIDLPGIYALTAGTLEENMVFQKLTSPGIDLILNVLDA